MLYILESKVYQFKSISATQNSIFYRNLNSAKTWIFTNSHQKIWHLSVVSIVKYQFHFCSINKNIIFKMFNPLIDQEYSMKYFSLKLILNL